MNPQNIKIKRENFDNYFEKFDNYFERLQIKKSILNPLVKKFWNKTQNFFIAWTHSV